MKCPECQHENPDTNRFCGQCGALLPADHSRRVEGVSISPVAHEVRVPEKPTERKQEKPAEVLPRPVRKEAESEREFHWQTAKTRSAVSGPSFLGLDDDEQEYRDRGDDLYGSHWGGRLGFALVILIVVGVLAFMQWKSNHPLISVFAPKPSPSETQANPQQPAAPGDMPASTQQNSQANAATTPPQSQPNGATTSTSAGTATQTVNAQQADTNKQGQPNSDQTSPATAGDNAAQKSAQEPSSSGTAPSSTEQKADTSKNEESAKKPSDTQSAAAADNSTSAQSEAATPSTSESKPAHAKRAARESSAASKPDQLQPVRQAESYIDAQQCDRGVNLLQSASSEGNTQAVIKLGALYATGTCVPFDRVIAYHYFSRAFRVEPDNTSLDHNRIMLWNEMSDAERQRAMAEDGSLEQ